MPRSSTAVSSAPVETVEPHDFDIIAASGGNDITIALCVVPKDTSTEFLTSLGLAPSRKYPSSWEHPDMPGYALEEGLADEDNEAAQAIRSALFLYYDNSCGGVQSFFVIKGAFGIPFNGYDMD